MTKHEHNIMCDLIEAIKSSVDMDAVDPRLGEAVNAADDLLTELLGVCEHGVVEGGWCEPCNKEYKRAARAAGLE